MASDKAERLLNLYIMLLAQTRFVPKQDIRRAHYGEYPDNARVTRRSRRPSSATRRTCASSGS